MPSGSFYTQADCYKRYRDTQEELENLRDELSSLEEVTGEDRDEWKINNVQSRIRSAYTRFGRIMSMAKEGGFYDALHEQLGIEPKKNKE